MNLVLSAHFDIAKPVSFIALKDGLMQGLVDNFAGVFVAYQAARSTKAPLYLTNFEETGYGGATELVKKLSKDTLVIVVDTTRDAEDKAAYIGNVYNFDITALKKKFGKKIFFMPGLFE